VKCRCCAPAQSAPATTDVRNTKNTVDGQRPCRVSQMRTTIHVPTSYSPDSAHDPLGGHPRPRSRHKSATTDPAPQCARGASVAERPKPTSAFLAVPHPVLTLSIFPTTTFPFGLFSPPRAPPRAVATGLTTVVSPLRPLRGSVASRLVAAASRTKVLFRASSPLSLCSRAHRRPPRSVARATSRLKHMSVVEVVYPRAHLPRGPTPSSWLTRTRTARELSSRTLPQLRAQNRHLAAWRIWT